MFPANPFLSFRGSLVGRTFLCFFCRLPRMHLGCNTWLLYPRQSGGGGGITEERALPWKKSPLLSRAETLFAPTIVLELCGPPPEEEPKTRGASG